ncbi:hypothetical protein [Sporosarcina sp. HYO08]|uniref:hypothetical protein n=1 Tax=Sporosarcina sp. HYO08 TaxID=1759557 RepID=UPI0007987849|nr:hypothetical protein [Sporosarcina sp. HYO08]KXH87373.1 hypothetical protein AU377_02025 [Sporosarcina sp. HYO08]
MRDITDQVMNESEFDFVGDKYFERFKGRSFPEGLGKSKKAVWVDLYELMNERRNHALQMFENEPNKTVFDVATITLLPVRVVKRLKQEFEQRIDWLRRNYLGESFDD